MKIFDQYIGKTVAINTAIVLAGLLALFSFFNFMDELGDVGKGNYGTWQAAQFVMMSIPRMVYQMFPIAALLGSLIGLGTLAGNNELIVIRAAGVSLARIIWSVMKVGLVMVILVIIFGEWLAPMSERYAQIFRSVAISDNIYMKSQYGLWARDGLSFVNIREILPQGRLGDVHIYEFDNQNRLKETLNAKEAFYQNNKWILEDVKQSTIRIDGLNVSARKQMDWDTLLSPDLLSVVIVKPDTLSIVGLYQYIHYLRDNGLNSDRYELAFWSKVVGPIVTGVMVFLAIPFVFGPLRTVSVGHRIVVGALMGTGFHLFNQVFTYLSLVFEFNPFFGATFPAATFFFVALYLMRKVY
jgi:lipopolysaccharide export system permease protein